MLMLDFRVPIGSLSGNAQPLSRSITPNLRTPNNSPLLKHKHKLPQLLKRRRKLMLLCKPKLSPPLMGKADHHTSISPTSMLLALQVHPAKAVPLFLGT